MSRGGNHPAWIHVSVGSVFFSRDRASHYRTDTYDYDHCIASRRTYGLLLLDLGLIEPWVCFEVFFPYSIHWALSLTGSFWTTWPSERLFHELNIHVHSIFRVPSFLSGPLNG